MKQTYLCTLVVVLASVITSPVTAAIRYNVTDLGTIPSYEDSRAWSINNKGQIVGDVFDYYSIFRSRAILFDPIGTGNNIDLGTLGGENSYAISINNNGQIVGGADSNDSQYSPQPTIFDPNGGGKNTGLGEKGHAHSINDHGQVVGCVGSLEDFGAALFDSTGSGNHIELGTLDENLHSVAYSTNNSGQIVGYAYKDFYAQDLRAVLFDTTGQGNNIDLGTLGGEHSGATSINDNGQIVGIGYISEEGLYHAAIFEPNGSGNNIDLGTIAGHDNSGAFCINNKGQIVGQALNDMYNPGRCAALFDPTGDGNNIDLNDMINPALGWTLICATSINDNGWIVGWGNNPDGFRRAFLLTPVRPGDSEPDRDVDLRDFAIFAAAWRSTPADDNWNPFCDISEPEDGSIDESDLAVFSDNYLMQSP